MWELMSPRSSWQQTIVKSLKSGQSIFMWAPALLAPQFLMSFVEVPDHSTYASADWQAFVVPANWSLLLAFPFYKEERV
jgi:hypothetical protein